MVKDKHKEIKPKLIFGDDNGFCSLWDIKLGKYNLYRERIDKAWGNGNDKKAEALEAELESHRIIINEFAYEDGYVPSYVGYLAAAYGIDTESN